MNVRRAVRPRAAPAAHDARDVGARGAPVPKAAARAWLAVLAVLATSFCVVLRTASMMPLATALISLLRGHSIDDAALLLHEWLTDTIFDRCSAADTAWFDPNTTLPWSVIPCWLV